MNAKHTPGPWHLKQTDDGNEVYSDASVRWIARVQVPEETAYPESKSQANADACLIAAAPSLYAESVELVRNSEPIGDGYVRILSKDVEALEAAIARAEGN